MWLELGVEWVYVARGDPRLMHSGLDAGQDGGVNGAGALIHETAMTQRMGVCAMWLVGVLLGSRGHLGVCE